MDIDALRAVDLPAEVDFAQLTEAQDAPIREATANTAQGLVHGARRARQTLDEIPVYVDDHLPLWAKITAFPVIASAGLSIGIFKRSYDTISDLPVAFMSIAEGRVGFADVGRGMWQMVKTDVAALPEVAQLMLHGRIMTAESRVGEVAFDVVPLMTGAGGALKGIPQAAARIATEGIGAGTRVVRGALATFGELIEPEFAMAGGPAGFRFPIAAADKIPANTLAMAGFSKGPKHLIQPAWQTKPVTLAEAPAKNWHPPTKLQKTPTVPSLSLDRVRIIHNITYNLGLSPTAKNTLSTILGRISPDVRIHPDSFRVIYNGKIPNGTQVFGRVVLDGKAYAIHYNPADTVIHLILQ